MATAEKRVTTQPPEKSHLATFPRNLDLVPSRLWDRLDRLLGDWDPLWTSIRVKEDVIARPPAIDVYEEEDAIVVETEVPGMKKEEIEVKLLGDLLTITGKHQSEKKVERKDYFRSERSSSAVSRSIRLPVEVQADKMTAQLKDGVLEIRAPRSETARAAGRSITVT
jgi:HSP20 family protein